MARTVSGCSSQVDICGFGVIFCEMCIKQEPDLQRHQPKIMQMNNSTLRKLVINGTETDPWTRPNMAAIIE